METYGTGRKITKSVILLCVVLACVLLIKTLVPLGDSKARLGEILLAQPAFAQQDTAFPADEAGISAYVNLGQSIDLAKAKSAMRGIQAEGNNYVIGIMELPGLPEEEFPHMYVSSDGWILAYYSKFAPAARIFQWYGYEGGNITTTTLQDAIAKICPAIGVNFAHVRENMGYYHFKYSDAARMTIAAERVDTGQTDSFNFSIPYGVTIYEGSWSHYNRTDWYSNIKIDSTEISKISYKHATGLECNQFEDQQITPEKLHTVELYSGHRLESPYWAGVAAIFIHR